LADSSRPAELIDLPDREHHQPVARNNSMTTFFAASCGAGQV
jgi:hypothetical protein